MSDVSRDRRVVSVPSTGFRAMLLLGVLLVIWGVYFLLAPIQAPGANGRMFECGTALSGPSSQFGRGVCGSANKTNTTKASFLAVGGLAVWVGGFLTFGMTRREESVTPVRTREPRTPRTPGEV